MVTRLMLVDCTESVDSLRSVSLTPGTQARSIRIRLGTTATDGL